MKIHIKNMVCDRCRMVVGTILSELDIEPVTIQLGEVDLGDVQPPPEFIALFKEKIEAVGFELISDRKTQMIEGIRAALIDLAEQPQFEKVKLSDHLAGELNVDYGYLSSLFSSVEGVTIEQAFILQKVEKAKELLVYDELTLTNIALRMGYSSVAHLSRQFKQVTGLTPTDFKKLRNPDLRVPLDKL